MNPTFGDKVEGAHYQTRYGVYAVIPNQDKTKIILVQAPNGAWFPRWRNRSRRGSL